VYDLSKCRYWKEGVHVESPEEGIAGRDMTELLKTSKHGIKRVARYPYVAYIVEEGQATGE
jgi:predicted heme/steroid binding protein